MALVAKTPQEDPVHITYMLNSDMCDCYFLVGNSELCKPERIGVVMTNLLAQSEVLRSKMIFKEIQEKKDIVVSDTNPNTFKNLLRFVYGYDNTRILSFEDADDLLYLAEKYQVELLKDRLAERLNRLLTPKNICNLLNNPACLSSSKLKTKIDEILKNYTSQVFASPAFLDLTSDALTKVFEQDMISVPEIEVWKAALRWAKHFTKSDDVQAQRNALKGPAKKIRICTISADAFVKEVVPKDILTRDEIALVCKAMGTGEEEKDLVFFSNSVKSRENRYGCYSPVYSYGYGYDSSDD